MTAIGYPAVTAVCRCTNWLDPISPTPQLIELMREARAVSYERAHCQHQGEQCPE